MAFQICPADAFGNFWRKRAATPATIGALKLVALARSIDFAEFELRMQTPGPSSAPHPWESKPTPAATTSGKIRPSAVGPRELKKAVCVTADARASPSDWSGCWFADTSRMTLSLDAGLVAPIVKELREVAGLEIVSEDGP